MPVLNIKRKRFGKVVAIKFLEVRCRRAWWLCRCDCGKVKAITTHDLRRGHVKSCGCLQPTRHGYSGHKLYSVWSGIKKRCYDQKQPQYDDWGGRGIVVCQSWLNPGTFIRWCLSNGWEDGLTLDRKDNNKNYTPNNCRFVTTEVNNHNQRIRSDNKTGYRGVSKRGKRYRAQIQVRGKKKPLGTFDSAKEAAAHRDKYVVRNCLPHTLNLITLGER